MDGEPSRTHDPAGVGTVGVADGDVRTGTARVDELDSGRPQPEVDGQRVVDEDTVAAAKRVPLEPEHHDAPCFDGRRTAAHGSHSQNSSCLATGWAASSGNISRQRQHRRWAGSVSICGAVVVSCTLRDLLVGELLTAPGPVPGHAAAP